jgi:4-diphosphocytidyl-2-C-methyl-D-erythritol kinase
MRRVVLPSFAKVNLTLEVLNKRPDGFHNLRTIFHTISLADTITIDYEGSSSIELSISGSVDIPNNLILRAARAVLEATGRGANLRFSLEKRIPMGGGLGGGSSNAAVTLLSVSRLVDADVNLAELASSLGSDVPFFLHGGCALGLGRGTEITPLPDARNLPILLVTPGIHVSTPPAFASLRRTSEFRAPIDTTEALRTLLGSGTEFIAGVNDFEQPVFEAYPELAQIKQRLLHSGAITALMSGSGSSIFAVFQSEQLRAAASRDLDQAESVRFVGRAEYRQALEF